MPSCPAHFSVQIVNLALTRRCFARYDGYRNQHKRNLCAALHTFSVMQASSISSMREISILSARRFSTSASDPRPGCAASAWRCQPIGTAPRSNTMKPWNPWDLRKRCSSSSGTCGEVRNSKARGRQTLSHLSSGRTAPTFAASGLA